jgi:hypothetical protein
MDCGFHSLLLKWMITQDRVARIRKTRKIILTEELRDPFVIPGRVVNPIIPGCPFQPLCGVRPIRTPPLKILNLSIQIELKNGIGCLNLRETAVTDRETDLGKLPGPFFVKRNDEILDLINLHIRIGYGFFPFRFTIENET